MSRREKTIGTIRCSAHADTIRAIVSAHGLFAEPAETSDHFIIRSRGRGADPEIDAELFEGMRNELDRAARNRVVPNCTVVARREMGVHAP